MTTTTTYRNPVWPGYFADPFVLRARGAYWAYGTGPAAPDGRQFPVLRSDDLARWEHVAHALAPLPETRAFNHWAPEVAEHEGRFYLYYSASTSESDEHHRLRVAVADDPAGPFKETGRLLLPDGGFSIDAHPFRDPRTGKWYLFFAADYTDDAPHGTGLAVVPLGADLRSAAGDARPVLRASNDWQIYERHRNYKGRTWDAWHCVEGPFVLFHEGLYWCLYSGGAWHTESYGIGCAVADDPLGPWRDDLAPRGATVLRGTPEVVGPGHASVVLAPDGRTEMLVYHAWDPSRTARRMCIDPLRWTPEGPKCDGPSVDARRLPCP